jgi:hypothetical protein
MLILGAVSTAGMLAAAGYSVVDRRLSCAMMLVCPGTVATGAPGTSSEELGVETVAGRLEPVYINDAAQVGGWVSKWR